AGATLSRTARPAIDPTEAYRVYLALLNAAWSARVPEEELARQRAAKARLRPEDASADAVMLRAVDLSHRDWLHLNERRHQIRRAWAAFLREWDVLLCPAFATPALPHMQQGATWERTHTIDERAIPYNDMLFWPGITCGFHLPASVAPIGLSATGLPIGVQIVGPLFGDRTTIQVAELIEQAGHGFSAPPGWS
ncbi:MAG: amidase, partial [Acetobacteraceae bacterium]|nr:amidase [Acetobacteraceae bacterium]